MITENNLKAGLAAWKEMYHEGKPDPGEDIRHLDAEELYRMAEDGGVAQAGDKAVEHLSLCPVCLGEWAEWRRVLSAVAEADEEDTLVMSYGLLEAAATTATTEAVSVLSACGRFTLSRLPDIDNPTRGMLTVDLVSEDAEAMNGWHISVSDKNQQIMLAGRIFDGRLARKCENINDFDFSELKIVVKKNDEDLI